jgi:hypothetical protein
MGNMSVGHQIVFFTHLGEASAKTGPPVNGDKFTDNGASANGKMGGLSVKFEILRGAANGGVLKNITVRSNGDMVLDSAVRPYRCAGSNGNISFDNGIGANGDILIYPGR